MSTIFRKKSISYLIHSKHLTLKKTLREPINQALTGPRVSKAGRADLYCTGPYSQVFKHVFYRLDASEPQDWDFHSFPRLPDQLQGNGFNRRTGESSSLVPQVRLPAAGINCHGWISVCHCQGIGPGFLGSPGDKSNVCNEGGELDPEGTFGSGLPACAHNFRDAGGIATELHAPPLDVRAGDVQLIACQPVGVLQDADHLDIVLEGVAKDVGDDRRIEFSQYREFFGYEGSHAHILEPDGVEHP